MWSHPKTIEDAQRQAMMFLAAAVLFWCATLITAVLFALSHRHATGRRRDLLLRRYASILAACSWIQSTYFGSIAWHLLGPFAVLEDLAMLAAFLWFFRTARQAYQRLLASGADGDQEGLGSWRTRVWPRRHSLLTHAAYIDAE